MQEIDAYNICLRSAGLRRISEIDLDDQQTADLSEIIQEQKEQIQYDGYPWNMDRITLTPVGGFIDVSGYLRVELPQGLTVLDNKVWDPRNNEFYDETLVDIWVVSDRAFINIPNLFQNWLARRSATFFVNSINGPDDTYIAAVQQEREAFSGAQASDDAIWDPGVLWERAVRKNPLDPNSMDMPGWARHGYGYY